MLLKRNADQNIKNNLGEKAVEVVQDNRKVDFVRRIEQWNDKWNFDTIQGSE